MDFVSVEENKEVVRRFVEEVQNQGKLDLIDRLFAEDFVDHNPLPGFLPTKEGTKQMFTSMRKVFSDFRIVVHDMIAEGDRVATRKTLQARHIGEFLHLPPTGKSIQVEGIDIFRVARGQLTEHWAVMDQLSMMRQLGASPPA